MKRSILAAGLLLGWTTVASAQAAPNQPAPNQPAPNQPAPNQPAPNQPAPPSAVTRFGELHPVGDVPVALVLEWTSTGGGSVTVSAPGGRVRLLEGRPAHAWSAGNDEGLMVALVTADAEVEVAFVPVTGGVPGAPRRASIRRVAGADRTPVGAAVAARPDGFAVFWQEASSRDPNEAYRTFLARFDDAGRALGAAVEVHTVWPLADVVWLPEQQQYYFLLFYGSSSGARLCGVHVREATLTNVEHPFWVSPSGAIDEARLFRDGDRVRALYRGGPTGELLLESDVTRGEWAREPPRPTSHGTLRPSEAFGARVTAGRLSIRRRDLADLAAP